MFCLITLFYRFVRFKVFSDTKHNYYEAAAIASETCANGSATRGKTASYLGMRTLVAEAILSRLEQEKSLL